MPRNKKRNKRAGKQNKNPRNPETTQPQSKGNGPEQPPEPVSQDVDLRPLPKRMATEPENTELSIQGAEASPVGPGVGTEAKAAADDPDVDNTPELCKDPRFIQLWVDTLEKVAIDPECELIPLMRHLRIVNETTLVGYRRGKIRMIYDTHPTMELNENYELTAALGGAICSAFPTNIFLNRCGCLMRSTPEMIEIVDTHPRPLWPQTGSPRIRMAYDSQESEPDAPPGLSRKANPCIPRTLKPSTLEGKLEGEDGEERKEGRVRGREEESEIMEDIYHAPNSDTWYSANELNVEEFSQRIPMDNERLESILSLLAPWKYHPQEWFYPDEKAEMEREEHRRLFYSTDKSPFCSIWHAALQLGYEMSCYRECLKTTVLAMMHLQPFLYQMRVHGPGTSRETGMIPPVLRTAGHFDYKSQFGIFDVRPYIVPPTRPPPPDLSPTDPPSTDPPSTDMPSIDVLPTDTLLDDVTSSDTSSFDVLPANKPSTDKPSTGAPRTDTLTTKTEAIPTLRTESAPVQESGTKKRRRKKILQKRTVNLDASK